MAQVKLILNEDVPGLGNAGDVVRRMREHYALFLMRKLVEHFDRYLGRGPRPQGRAN